MNNNLDHVCLAVKSIEKAAEKICNNLGYKIKTKIVLNTRQDVFVQFLGKNGSIDIKLIMPGSLESPLILFLKNKGEGLHHLGFRTDDIENALDELKSKGALCTLSPEPGEAFCNELIAFSYLGHGLNVEFIDTDKRVFIDEY
ncbi:MAG: VOC family protein [Gammaproteobacteria bacterium]|nr:VOC family protein [Gammaproteobacteria bacterium]